MLKISSTILFLNFACILTVAAALPQIATSPSRPPGGPAVGIQFLPSPQIPVPSQNSGALDYLFSGTTNLLDFLFRIVG